MRSSTSVCASGSTFSASPSVNSATRAGRMDAPLASAPMLSTDSCSSFSGSWHKSLPRYGGMKREICSCPDSSSRVRSMTISLIWSTSSCGAMASSALPAASRTGRCSLTHRRLEKCSAVWNAASGWLRTYWVRMLICVSLTVQWTAFLRLLRWMREIVCASGSGCASPSRRARSQSWAR